MEDNIFEQTEMKPTFVFVDGSYYNFYRYYALLQWWKNAFPEEPLVDPFQNKKFVEKFKKIFIENLKQIPTKLKIPKTTKPIMIVGKDCKRENIWRMELFEKYKAGREREGFMGGPFFKMAYEEELFQKGGIKAILKHPKLEADDCIAISVKYLINKYPECNIYIITSDKDYLQLNYSNVNLFNLGYKKLEDSKLSTCDPKKDLEIKIIMGDSSDNIPSVFPKCGLKTAQKCVEDSEFFKKKMADNSDYYKQYELNQKLINFNNIPQHLIDEFMDTIKK